MKGNQSVVGTICSSHDSYFDAEKKIADCIIERKEDVIDMTVAELAKASGTSRCDGVPVLQEVRLQGIPASEDVPGAGGA